ncbi:MAG: hypothetical protein ABSD08_22630 [Xanthobacteraceae bacterium]|jgi:hypothetical protein
MTQSIDEIREMTVTPTTDASTPVKTKVTLDERDLSTIIGLAKDSTAPKIRDAIERALRQ